MAAHGGVVYDRVSDVVFEKVINEVCSMYGIEDLKPLQRLCLKNLTDERDVLACLPTSLEQTPASTLRLAGVCSRLVLLIRVHRSPHLEKSVLRSPIRRI